MGKRLISISKKLTGAIPALALLLAVHSSNATCFCWLYQPDLPDELQSSEKE